MNDNIIQFKNIDISFGERKLLENFNLTVKKGEKIHVYAPSGKGKTTLLKLLMGFHQISSGEILLDDSKLSEENIDVFRKKIGYLSQEMSFRNLKISLLIDEILDYRNNKSLKLNKEEFISFVKNMSDYLELNENVMEKEINSLSGGEKQRIGFLILNLLQRDIWLLDEITSSLDSHLKEKVISYILNTDKTVILISHDTTESLDKFRKVIL